MNTDRIEKKILLKASRTKVWRAISDARQFGTWFRLELEGPFVEGKTTRGHVTYPGYENKKVAMEIERIQPEDLFTWRWHPYAIDPKVDYSAEPTTLVEMRLSESAGGTLLTVVESGFDKLPAHRREEAFRMNDGGWTEQMKNIEKHVAG
jgi:uncharacterized protein YndB with AHSA1/START domain